MSTGHRCVRKQAFYASVLVRKCLGINKNAPDRLKHTRSPDQSPFTPLPSNQVLACRCVSEMMIEVAAIDPLVAEATRRASARLANLGESNGGVGAIKQSRMSDPRPDGSQPLSGATDGGGECGTPLLYNCSQLELLHGW